MAYWFHKITFIIFFKSSPIQGSCFYVALLPRGKQRQADTDYLGLFFNGRGRSRLVAVGRGWSRLVAVCTRKADIAATPETTSEDLIGRGRRRAGRQATSSATNRDQFFLLGLSCQRRRAQTEKTSSMRRRERPKMRALRDQFSRFWVALLTENLPLRQIDDIVEDSPVE